jgi:hypothetical protein
MLSLQTLRAEGCITQYTSIVVEPPSTSTHKGFTTIYFFRLCVLFEPFNDRGYNAIYIMRTTTHTIVKPNPKKKKKNSTRFFITIWQATTIITE